MDGGDDVTTFSCIHESNDNHKPWVDVCAQVERLVLDRRMVSI